MAVLSLAGASKQISDTAVARIRAQLPKWGYANSAAGALDWLVDMARSTVTAAEASAPAAPPQDPDFPPPTVLLQAEAPEGERKTTRRKKAAKRGR
jgi:hypothetical protein